jgi:DNA-binding MarR family transcriptional regulator
VQSESQPAYTQVISQLQVQKSGTVVPLFCYMASICVLDEPQVHLPYMDQLAKLFGSAARLKLLRLFMFNDDTAFTLSEVSSRARVTKEAARREIKALIAAGLLKKKTGTKDSYQASRQFEYYDALMAFMRTTTTVGDKLVLEAFKKAGPLRLVTLSGLFTGALESKVDIIVVGDRLDEKIVATAVHMIEAEIGRELRYASFPTEEYRYRAGVYDRLIRDAYDYPHRTILNKIGS